VPRPAKVEGVESWTLETAGIRGFLWGFAFRPDGKAVAVASDDGVVRVYDTATARLSAVFLDHRPRGDHWDWPFAVAWSPDGKRLAARYRTRVITWTADGGLVHEAKVAEGHTQARHWMAFSPDGRWLALADYHQTVLFSAKDGKPARKVGGKGVWAAFSPDSRALAVTNAEGVTEVIDLAGEEASYFLPLKDEGPPSWSPDGAWLTTSQHAWKMTPGKPMQRPGLKPERTLMKGHRFLGGWKGDSALVVVFTPVGSNGVHQPTAFYRLPTRGGEASAPVKAGAALSYLSSAPAVSPDGGLVAGNYALHSNTGYGLRLMDTSTGKAVELPEMTGASGFLQGMIRGIPGGEELWLFAKGKSRVISARDGAVVGDWVSLPKQELIEAFSPDGQWAVSGAHNKVLHRRGRARPVALPVVAQREPGRNHYWDKSVAFTADGRTVFAMNGRAVSVLDTETAALLHVLRDNTAQNIAVSPDGSWLVDFGHGMLVRPAGREAPKDKAEPQAILKGWSVRSVAFSGDGKVMAAALGAEGVGLWQVDGWKRLPAPKLRPIDARGVAFHGQVLAIEGEDANAAYDVAAGKALWHLVRGHYYVTIGNYYGQSPIWLAGGKAFLIDEQACLVALDAQTGEERGRLLKLADGGAMPITPEGHCKAASVPAASLVVVARIGGNLQTFPLAEFEKRFGWKNDPKQAVLPVR
jgi:WD40 repeat protein